MGSYLDTTWGDLFALTRQRRLETRVMAAAESVRYSVSSGEFHRAQIGKRHRKAARRWRSAQWAAGVRACGYCGVELACTSGQPNSATVDHREPWAGGILGRDRPSNWIMACFRCNQRKADMPEAQFRALICTAA